MGAVPKRRISKSRSGERRSHLALKPSMLVECPQCHKPRMPHRACPACGSYKGLEVVSVKASKEKK